MYQTSPFGRTRVLSRSLSGRTRAPSMLPGSVGSFVAMPVASYVARFRDEFQRHIDEGGCPFAEHSPITPLYHAELVH